MYGSLMFVAAIVAMVKIASWEGRSPWFWGIYTFVLITVAGQFVSFFSPLIGLVASYATMFIHNLIKQPPKESMIVK